MNLHPYRTAARDTNSALLPGQSRGADRARPAVSIPGYRRRLLRWTFPIFVLAVVLVYELAAARWIHQRMGYSYHVIAEILFFAIVGPALAFSSALFLERWLDERDTSDWQATLLARARADARHGRKLNDDALQALFAAGIIIKTLRAASADLSPELEEQVVATECALQDASERLRNHLRENQPRQEGPP